MPKRYCLFPPKPCFRLPCGKLHLTRTHYFRRYPRIVIFSFANGLLPICRNVITALPKHYSLFSPKPCCRLLCGKLHLTWTHYFRRYPQNRHFLFAKGLLPLYRSVITALPKRYYRFAEALLPLSRSLSRLPLRRISEMRLPPIFSRLSLRWLLSLISPISPIFPISSVLGRRLSVRLECGGDTFQKLIGAKQEEYHRNRCAEAIGDISRRKNYKTASVIKVKSTLPLPLIMPSRVKD